MNKEIGKNDVMFAGYRRVELFDEQLDITFPMFVMYPTITPEKLEKIGPYHLNVSSNAVPQEGMFRLVLISHGTGGSPLVYRTIARHLARNEFVVGMLEHPYNNRNDNTLEGTIDNLTIRPKHISILSGIEAMHMIKKRQINLENQSVKNQNKFIYQVFDLIV